jgi:hypothetical protein
MNVDGTLKMNERKELTGAASERKCTRYHLQCIINGAYKEFAFHESALCSDYEGIHRNRMAGRDNLTVLTSLGKPALSLTSKTP